MASKDTLRGGMDQLQAFLDHRDLQMLEDAPLTFQASEDFKSYMCCMGACGCVWTLGIQALCAPVGTFCPGTMFKHFQLQLDHTSVRLKTARNDCCCHIAISQLSTPLDKVQDVSLAEDWLKTMFGLKQVNVDSAGTGGVEVQAPFLAYPEKARDAIQLAVKLVREQGGTAAGAPSAMSMHRPPAAQGGSLKQRLDTLHRLVARSTLTQAEADEVKVDVLAAKTNPLLHLQEAADLVDAQQISPDEFRLLKNKLLAQIKRQADD